MHIPARDPNDLERFFVERANAGDVEGLVSLYESTAILDPGDGKVAIGKEEIRKFFIKFLASCPQLTPSNQRRHCAVKTSHSPHRILAMEISPLRSRDASRTVIGFGPSISLPSKNVVELPTDNMLRTVKANPSHIP